MPTGAQLGAQITKPINFRERVIGIPGWEIRSFHVQKKNVHEAMLYSDCHPKRHNWPRAQTISISQLSAQTNNIELLELSPSKIGQMHTAARVRGSMHGKVYGIYNSINTTYI